MVVEKALRIEFLGDARAAVINRNAARTHAIDEFFRDVTRNGLIFEGQVKLVRPQKFVLRLGLEWNVESNIVERASGGIALLALIEFLEKFGAQARLAVGITRHKAAELGLLPENLLPFAGLFHKCLRLEGKNVVRQAEMPRVIHVTRSEGVIALVEIRKVHFRRKVDFLAGEKTVALRAKTIEQVVRRCGQLDVEPLPQDSDEKILIFVVARAEVAHVKIDFLPNH